MGRSAKVIHRGVVEQGKLKFYYPEMVNSAIRALEGKEFEVILQEKLEDVTPDQRGYYRGVVIRECCMNHEAFGGNTEDDIHDFFAQKFLSYVKNREINGENIEMRLVESTGEIGKKRMAWFVDQVIMWLSMELGIVVPEPENFDLKKYKTVTK